MKDKNGKTIRQGSWLLCINDVHSGETVQVESYAGQLVLPDCNGISCEIPLSGFAEEDGALVDYVVIENPFKKLRYADYARKYSNLNLVNANEERYINTADLNAVQIAKLRSYGYEDIYPDIEEKACIKEMDVIAADCDGIDYEYCDVYQEEEELDNILSLFIKDASHYLVFASGCRWNGASGYKICDNRPDTIYRNYGAAIYPTTASSNGKTLVCREYSHDVPTGSTTTIVALTEKEYEQLEKADFDKVRKFSEHHRETATKNRKKG